MTEWACCEACGRTTDPEATIPDIDEGKVVLRADGFYHEDCVTREGTLGRWM